VDNLTHSLFGATLARTPLGRAGRGTTAALILASNAPDVDIVTLARGGVKYLEWHRGMTHGPLGIAGLAVLSAAIVAAARRINPRWSRPDDAPFHMLVAVALVGTIFHVLMDLPTSYGVRLLSPFSWRWYSVDWMPIVDIYLLIALAAGLLFGRVSDAAKRRSAIVALVFAAAIYGLRATGHQRAMELAPRLFGPTLPPPCDPGTDASALDWWPRPLPSPPDPGHRCVVEIAAMPTFLSPFKWRVIAQMSNAYELHDLDVLDTRFAGGNRSEDVFWRQVTRYPNIWSTPVQQAAATRLGAVFLGFSRFPAARFANDGDGSTIVRFTDVRFIIGPRRPDQPASRGTQPFTATIRLDAQGRATSESLGR